MRTPTLLSRGQSSGSSGAADVNGWSRGRLLGVLSGAAVVAVVLVVGLGYAIHLGVARAGAGDATTRGVATGVASRPASPMAQHGATRSPPSRCSRYPTTRPSPPTPPLRRPEPWRSPPALA